MRNLAFPYTDSRRRKSAVQIHWISDSTMTVNPNVTRSELKALMSKRAKTHCSATPSTKNSGTISASVRSGSTPPTVES